jgi:hypothetical protein
MKGWHLALPSDLVEQYLGRPVVIAKVVVKPPVFMRRTQTGRPPLTGVINHISWGVQPWDTNAVEAELRRRGLNPRPDMVGDNFKSFHVNDPDGWDLQISNQTKDSRGGAGA